MADRAYIRERKGGATPAEQVSALAAVVETTGTHPPIYTDLLKLGKKSKVPLPARGNAINSLRSGNTLWVYDLATLGTSFDDIVAAMAAIGKKGATLGVLMPEQEEHTWQPDAADLVQKAREAASVLKSDVHKRARAKHLGAPPKWTPEVAKAALEGWKNPALTAPQVPAYVLEKTGVQISERLIWNRLKPLTKSQAEGTL
jgi:hypothetical protein